MLRFMLLLALAVMAPSGAPAQVIEDDPGAVQDRDPETVTEADRIQAGGRLARDWCGPCHAGDGRTLSDAAPSLRALSRLDAAVLRTVLSQPHPPMPPLTLSNAEIDDLIAYLTSLRTKAPR